MHVWDGMSGQHWVARCVRVRRVYLETGCSQVCRDLHDSKIKKLRAA